MKWKMLIEYNSEKHNIIILGDLNTESTQW